MKNKHIILSVLFLLIGINLLVSVSYANAFSETIPLAKWTSIVRMVELQKGDQIAGDFTFSGIPLRQGILGGASTWGYRITLYEPSGNKAMEYQQTDHQSFSYTASQSGNYKFEFYVGYGPKGQTGGDDFSNARVSLSYDITKASTNPINSNTVSETFQLFDYNSISKIVNLNKDDQLVGDFSISNCPVDFSVVIKDPQDQVVLTYSNEHQESFSFTAFYTGQYSIRFNTGNSNNGLPNGFPYVQATLNYQVVKPYVPTQAPSDESLIERLNSLGLPIWLILGLIVGIISIIALVVYTIRNPDRKKP